MIAADLGGPVETVEHGVTGWRVPPGDADALAAAIDGCWRCRRAARARWARQPARRCCAATPCAAMQEATLDVYEAVMDPAPQ